MDFSIPGLQKLIQDYKMAGYSFRKFTSVAPDEFNEVYLRHDVDVDVDLAVKMASLEARACVSATFFVMVSSDLYNLRSKRTLQSLSEILSLGHNIGLHFDPSITGDGQLLPALLSEIGILESAIHKKVDAFSWHKPSAHGIPTVTVPPNFTDVYSDSWFSNFHYNSDSSGWWSYGDFRKSEDFTNRQSLQLLLHPIWWMSETPAHPSHQLGALEAHKNKIILESLHKVSPQWKSYKTNNKQSAHSWPESVR
jgi:hypothetical protein